MEPLLRRYRSHLQAIVAAAAAPYGYTLTIWTSGAITSNAEGLPTAFEALLFLAGAVGGFAIVGTIAHGGASRVLRPGSLGVRLWGGFHLPGVGAAIGAAALVLSLVHGWVTWPLVGFLATAVYLVVIAGQFTVADTARAARLPRSEDPGPPR